MAFLGIPTSRKDLGNAGWVKGAATSGARLSGNIAGAFGQKNVAANYRGFADAVDDPNKGYAGTLNPLNVLNVPNNGQGGSGKFNFTAAAPAAGGSPQVKDSFHSSDDSLYGGAYGGAYGDGSGASAAKYDPNTDQVRINQKRAEIRGLMSMFESAFNDVLGRVDSLAAEKRGEFEKNYADQQVGLDKNFGNTTTGIDDQYGARNAYHSSYRESAQQQAKDAYDTATGQLVQAKDRDLGSVGQFAEQQKAELSGGRPTFNVDDYNQVDDLLSIGQDVQAAINKLNTTGAGLRTNSAYKANLDRIAPTQEQGSSQLKGMLDKLSNTGGNPDAKRAIAMSTIAKVGGDQTAWMDYFEKQMQQTGSNAVVEPTNIQLAA